MDMQAEDQCGNTEWLSASLGIPLYSGNHLMQAPALCCIENDGHSALEFPELQIFLGTNGQQCSKTDHMRA